LLEHQLIEHAPADVGEGAAAAGHFHRAARRAHRLRGGRSVVERQPDFAGHGAALAGHVNPCIGIAIAERRETVEHVVRPAIPEIAHVERRVDHRRRVTPGAAAHVDAADLENAVGLLGAFVETRLIGFDEVGVEHALGADHVIARIDDRRVALQWIAQHMGREVGFLQRVVRPALAAGQASRRTPRHRECPTRQRAC
jgi:hypothetical protein